MSVKLKAVNTTVPLSVTFVRLRSAKLAHDKVTCGIRTYVGEGLSSEDKPEEYRA